MTVTSRIRWLVIIAVALIATGCATQRPIAESTASRTAPQRAAIEGNPQCNPATIGYIGIVLPGQSTAARNALGSALLAQVTDSTSGQLDLARSAGGMNAATVASVFSDWQPVLSQSSQPSLRSCDMMLSDRPAAQPLITAAIASVIQHGYASSTTAFRSELQEVLIGDNPLRAGSVIITLFVPGPAQQLTNGPLVYDLSAYTVIEDQSDSQPTAVTEGGFYTTSPN